MFGKADDNWKLQTAAVRYSFDDIDVHEFLDLSFGCKLSYFNVFLKTLISFIAYSIDIAILILLLSDFSTVITIILEGEGKCDSNRYGAFICWSSFKDEVDASIISVVPLPYRLAIILLTVLVNFVLLVVDWYKAANIIRYPC